MACTPSQLPHGRQSHVVPLMSPVTGPSSESALTMPPSAPSRTALWPLVLMQRPSFQLTPLAPGICSCHPRPGPNPRLDSLSVKPQATHTATPTGSKVPGTLSNHSQQVKIQGEAEEEGGREGGREEGGRRQKGEGRRGWVPERQAGWGGRHCWGAYAGRDGPRNRQPKP